MKIKKQFVLRQVAGMWTVLALADETVSFNGMLTINDAGALLWKTLEQGADLDKLVKALTDTYEVSQEQAAADAQSFVEKLRTFGCLED